MVEVCKFVEKPPVPPPKITPDYDYEPPMPVVSATKEKPIVSMTNESFVPDGFEKNICDVRL